MNIQQWESWLKSEIKGNVDIVVSYLKDGDTFVDVGGNTGIFTQMVLEQRNLSKVALFEPIPYLVEECRLKFDNDDRVIVNELALSDTKGESVIIASKQNLGYNKIYKEGMEMHSHEKFTIQLDTFTNWISDKNIDKVQFIKVDAEGHDINVIRGMFDWMTKTNNRPYILFEINWYKDLEQELISDLQNVFGYNSIQYKRDVLLTPPQ